jgi:hypothetical protein
MSVYYLLQMNLQDGSCAEINFHFWYNFEFYARRLILCLQLLLHKNNVTSRLDDSILFFASSLLIIKD